jgi:hypothetical protein
LQDSATQKESSLAHEQCLQEQWLEYVSSAVPEDELKNAEQHLDQAVQLKRAIRTHPPESPEHYQAEVAYTQALSNANAHLCTALSAFTDPSMKNHIRVMMDYLNEIEQTDQCHSCKK